MFLGRHHTEDTKRKIGIGQSGKTVLRGVDNPAWAGGSSFKPYTAEFTNQLKELIRQRDNYKCQLCGVPECELSRKLAIHHIDYTKENCNPINLISLCARCNGKANIRRDYWQELLQTIMSDIQMGYQLKLPLLDKPILTIDKGGIIEGSYRGR